MAFEGPQYGIQPLEEYRSHDSNENETSLRYDGTLYITIAPGVSVLASSFTELLTQRLNRLVVEGWSPAPFGISNENSYATTGNEASPAASSTIVSAHTTQGLSTQASTHLSTPSLSSGSSSLSSGSSTPSFPGLPTPSGESGQSMPDGIEFVYLGTYFPGSERHLARQVFYTATALESIFDADR